MHGTRYNVPLLNALAFYVGIQVGFTTPAPSALLPKFQSMWRPAQWSKLAIATLVGYSIAYDALLNALACYLGVQVGVTVPEHVHTLSTVAC